jgi:hypothetical protein
MTINPTFPDSYKVYAYLSSAWTDITADVITDPISARWGLPGNGVNDRLADIGEITFTLNNTSDKYTPGIIGAVTGWDFGTPIKVVLTYDSIDYVKPKSYVSQIDPVIGLHANEARVKVTALDWMDFANKFPLIASTIQTNQTADVALTTILADMPIQPADTDFDTGTSVFPALFDTTTTGTDAYTEINKFTISEMGYTYVKRDQTYGETLVFESNNYRNGLRALKSVQKASVDITEYFLLNEDDSFILNEDDTFLVLESIDVEDVVIDNSMAGADVVYGKNIINYVVPQAHPKKVDASLKVLYSLDSAMAIGSGQTITFKGTYSDPTGGATVNAISTTMVTPVPTTDYQMWTASDGTGTNLTAYLSVSVVYGSEAPTYTVTNTSSYSAYITKLQARGYGIYSYNPISAAQEDTISIEIYGYQSETIDQLYQRDLSVGEAEAKKIIDLEKNPRSVLQSISMNANSSGSLMKAFLCCDIGDLVHIKQTRNEIDGYYYIQSVSYEIQTGGIIFFTWGLKQSFSLSSGDLSLIAAEFATREVVPAVPPGSDPYCMSLLHMNGADTSTTFTDEVAGKTWTAYNGAQIDTAIKKFGTGSGLFDGVDDYVDTPAHADFNFGTGDFTIEWQEYRTTTTGYQCVLSQESSIVTNFGLFNIGYGNGDTTIRVDISAYSAYDVCWGKNLGSVALNTFVHKAISRQGNTFRCFSNGVLTDTWTSSISLPASTYPFMIGRSGTWMPYFTGWIDEVRISKGICRYTADFTPPIAEFVASTPEIPAVYAGGALYFGHVPQITNLQYRSLSLWIYYISGAGFPGVAAFAPIFQYTSGETLSSGNMIYILRGNPANTNTTLYINSGNFATAGSWYHSNAFQALEWAHICVTYETNNVSAVPKFYINGSSISVSTSASPSGAYKGEDDCLLSIGALSSSNAFYNYTTFAMDATIKDYRIYDKILSAAEVLQIYTEGVGGTGVTDGLVFQPPCVYTKRLADFIDQDITATNRILDNVYGNVGIGAKSQVGITGIYPVGRAI